MRFAVLHSNPAYLTGLRLPLLRHLAERGEVIGLAPRMEARHLELLRTHGIQGAGFRLSPTGLNPVRDAADTVRLARQLRALRPDVVVTNTVKPVIYGTFAARLAGVPHRYALISGLGYAFTDDGSPAGWRKRLVRGLTRLLYRLAFSMNERVIFQNRDDLDEVVAAGICPAAKAAWVAGSGVDTQDFPLAAGEPAPVFIMVSRLLAEKGVREYLAAARRVRARRPDARFLLIGDADRNPSALDPAEIRPFVEDGSVEWPGAVDDVRPWLRRASVFVLPSYREGVPRSTLEAMATGLAVITTDVPGCRETVPTGANGILVPVRDVGALAAAMERLAADPARIARMGRASRRLAESTFDTSIVHRQIDVLLGLAAVEGGGAGC